MNNRAPILEVHDLCKTFTERSMITGKVRSSYTALNNVSFTLHTGEVLGVLGPNGAGKTTLMQILLNVMTPTSGSVRYFGKNFFEHSRELLRYISFASTYVQLPGNLTIYENLSIYAQLYGIIGQERERKIKLFLDQFGMWHARNKLCKHLSAGQITRVMLAKAFMTEPKIILLDEPTASLDPDIALDVRNFIIAQQREFGVSILFTSHNMAEVAQVCDRVLVLKRGNLIANNSPEELVASIAEVRMQLTVPETAALELLLKEKKLIYSLDKHNISIELAEKEIPLLLAEIGKRGIVFTHISIEKPTLEDYFLYISRSNNLENT